MAECGPVRAVATGDTLEEAVSNLREAIEELVRQFGEEKVFEDVEPETELEVRVLVFLGSGARFLFAESNWLCYDVYTE
ncbi:MAG: hypothetical protein QHH75_06885 [Bacillota bacterium]|nr:hypothetical protein [Bacillota bacterium]